MIIYMIIYIYDYMYNHIIYILYRYIYIYISCIYIYIVAAALDARNNSTLFAGVLVGGLPWCFESLHGILFPSFVHLFPLVG